MELTIKMVDECEGVGRFVLVRLDETQVPLRAKNGPLKATVSERSLRTLLKGQGVSDEEITRHLKAARKAHRKRMSAEADTASGDPVSDIDGSDQPAGESQVRGDFTLAAPEDSPDEKGGGSDDLHSTDEV